MLNALSHLSLLSCLYCTVSEEVFCLVWYQWVAEMFSRGLERAAPVGSRSLSAIHSFFTG